MTDLLQRPLFLPPPLQRRLETAARDFIHPGPGPAIDFSQPAGEAALLGPDSVSWQVFKNPLSLFIGGVTAVLLELAEPRIRSGLWTHTSFRRDALPRLRRTGLAAMMTVYGPRSQAEAMIAGVTRLHRQVSGATPDGQPYRADDPELLAWVHATAGFGFLEAYHAYVRPLPASARDRFYAEGAASARLYGAHTAPHSQEEQARLFEAMRGRLEASPVIFEFLAIMRGVPLLPPALAPAHGILLKAAVALLPAWVRAHLQLDAGWRLPPWQRKLLKAAGMAADRIVLRSAPAAQACRRLGLPEDYLYRRP